MSIVRRRSARYNLRPLGYGAGMQLARTAYNNRNRIVSVVRNSMFNRTRSMTQNRVTSGQGVTSQYDKKVIYRKRYMPRYKKRRWRKFKNRVLAVSTKSLGSNTVVRNSLIQSTLALIPGNDVVQNFVQLALYGVRSGSDWLNDLNEISTDTRLSATSKIIFQSAVLDITMRAQSIPSSGIATGNPSIGLEVDVYEIIWNGPTGQIGEANNLEGAFNVGATDTAVIPGQTNALVPTNRGWTPFDANAALSQHRIKILKKTKYFLSAEQTATYQIRDPKSHIFSKDSIPGGDSTNWPGITRWIWIQWKPIPGYNYILSPNNDQARLNIGVTRKYMYKINEDSTDYDMYNT